MNIWANLKCEILEEDSAVSGNNVCRIQCAEMKDTYANIHEHLKRRNAFGNVAYIGNNA